MKLNGLKKILYESEEKIILGTGGDDWDYKKSGNDYFARKKGTKNWIITKGSVKTAIATKIFGNDSSSEKNKINSDDEDKEVKQIGSCSPTEIKASSWVELYKKLALNKMITNGEPLLIVWGPTQTIYYTEDGKSTSITDKVSTGAGGFGNVSGEKKTSMGLLKIVGKKIGKDYEIMVGKKGTGIILGPNQDSTRVVDGRRHIAEVLTGILELDGLEVCNRNTFSRRVYVHGTNREGFLGTKRSNGCVRVSNQLIKKLVNTINVGTKVYIYPGE